MTAKDVEGAMEIECALGEQRRAAERAKWFRARLEAAAELVAEAHGGLLLRTANAIRSIPVPEDV